MSNIDHRHNFADTPIFNTGLTEVLYTAYGMHFACSEIASSWLLGVSLHLNPSSMLRKYHPTKEKSVYCFF